jgi:hypothetical protein
LFEAASISSTAGELPAFDLDAHGAGHTGLSSGTFLAIKRFGQNAGARSFAATPWTGKQISMGNAIVVDGIGEGLDH